MIKEKIELVGGVEIAEDVKGRFKNVGVRGMDIEKAKELGFFRRISNLLCACHASIMAAYRIYGGVDYMLTEFGGRRNEIAHEMGMLEKAFTRFINFWTGYYANGEAGREMNEETENLYHRIMEWADLPEQWSLGDAQRTERDGDVAIKVDGGNGRQLYFRRTDAETESVGETLESWCVTKYDTREHRQTTVNADMDKASALMVAKRLSEEDGENIYTASIVSQCLEKRIGIVPFKAFKTGATVGKITRIEK